MAHAATNIPGKIIHDKFEELMRAISFRKDHVKFLIETSKNMLIEPVKLKNARHKEKLEELRIINEKIYKLEERLVNEEIDGTTYQTWFKKLQQEKRMTESTLNTEEKPKIKSDADIVEKLLPWLENLSLIYEKSNVTQKHTLIRGMFEDSLVWGKGLFRTRYIQSSMTTY